MKKQLVIKWLIFGLFLLAIFLGTQMTQASQTGRVLPTSINQWMMVRDIDSLQTVIIDHPELKLTIIPLMTERVGTATQVAINIGENYTQSASGKISVVTPVPPLPDLPTTTIFPTKIEQGDFSTFIHSNLFNDNIESVWSGQIMNQNIYVFSGAEDVDPMQGVLDIQVMARSTYPQTWVRYLSPVRSGSLRIQSIDGYRLTLTTKSGVTIYFDVASQSFISSLDAVSPVTKTPMPNITPTSWPTLNQNTYSTPFPNSYP